jgi:uncharacterized membrane protein YoaK (UPF0700 family)
MRPSVPVLLSFNGGYVDTAGFLAIQGLFSAHVTGNFVTIGAALVNGTSGVLTKLLALPVFCIVVLLTRLASFHLSRRTWTSLEMLLALKVSLLIAAAVMAILWGPFTDGDSGPAMITGMTLVAAMAIQNAVHRIHLGTSPPSTLMTGTTTQTMMDLADLLRGLDPQARAATVARIRSLSKAIASFALGAASCALLFHWATTWNFALPPLVALLALLAGRESKGRTS